MNIRTSRSDLLAHARAGSGSSDDEIVSEFATYQTSYNAEAAFCGLLAMACEIAIQRPQLIEKLLPAVTDPAHVMGIDSAEGFIEYAKVLIDHDALKDPKCRQFSKGGTDYFHQFMSVHLAAIQNILMRPRDEQTEVPVTKNSGIEGPIPSAWRPILKNIVDAFVSHDYCLAEGMIGVAPVPEKTATQIRNDIQDYGAKLVALPQASWDTSVCIWMEDHWDALIDLWTVEEGSSDLVLQVHVSEVASEHVMTVYMVYVP